MAHILVFNCGSSSVKFQVFDAEGLKLLGGGIAEALFTVIARIKYKFDSEEKVECLPDNCGHEKALEHIFALLEKRGFEIGAVGHRVAAGGEMFRESVIVDHDVMEGIEKFAYLAPLHNPPNLLGIRFVTRKLKGVPNVAVFDTAFFAQMPKVNYIYAISEELYEKSGIRRYGYHGISYQFVAPETARFLDRPLESLRMVICHLGSGTSMAAVKNGVGVDCTLGFSTLAGTVMSTRSGDIDPAIPLFLLKQGYSFKEVNDILFSKSGLFGLCGEKDMRLIQERMSKGDQRAQLAFEIFCSKVKKFIGSFAAELGGIDALVFTAGIGENSPEVRKFSTDNLGFMGIEIDEEQNQVRSGANRRIGKGPVEVLVIPTDEELLIAAESARLALR